MAIKTPTPAPTVAPAPTSAAPSNALAALSGLKLFDIAPPKPAAGDLFPMVKIPYPIELGDVFKAGDLFRCGLFDGKVFTHLKVPFVVTVLAAREATRRLTTNEKGEKEYERAYKPMGAGFDGSAPVFEQHLQDSTAERGVSYMVAIVQPDNSVALAEIPAFKLMKDYWGNPLHQALSSNGRGATVKIEDHAACQTTSKKTGNKYLDPGKFNKAENISVSELPEEQLKLVAQALEAQKDKFLAWAKR